MERIIQQERLAVQHAADVDQLALLEVALRLGVVQRHPERGLPALERLGQGAVAMGQDILDEDGNEPGSLT
jgi:hypothetical protein